MLEYRGIEIEKITDGYRISFDYPLYFITSTIIEAKRTINLWYEGYYD